MSSGWIYIVIAFSPPPEIMSLLCNEMTTGNGRLAAKVIYIRLADSICLLVEVFLSNMDPCGGF